MWIWYTLWGFVCILGISMMLFSVYLDRNKKGVTDADGVNFFGDIIHGATHKPHDWLTLLGGAIVIIGIFALFLLDTSHTVCQLLEHQKK